MAKLLYVIIYNFELHVEFSICCHIQINGDLYDITPLFDKTTIGSYANTYHKYSNLSYVDHMD